RMRFASPLVCCRDSQSRFVAPAPGPVSQGGFMTDTSRRIDYADRGTVIAVPDVEMLARIAAETLITTAAEAAHEIRQDVVALSGGSTPIRMRALLATLDYANRVDWDALQIFWGDERWVPIAESESNAGEAIRDFLDQAPIPDEN